MNHAYSQLVHRAALPEVMFVADVAVALQLSPSSVRRAVLRGECGPYFRVGRRLGVRRESFLNALARRERSAAAAHDHSGGPPSCHGTEVTP